MTKPVLMEIPMQADIEIQRASKATGLPGDGQFQQWVNAVLSEADHPGALTIRIVDEHEARRFNLDYRRKDYATNVLSFPAELPEGLPAEVDEGQLGDILICAPVVAREAKQWHRTEHDHWAHLTIHGVLHLQGYDHQTADEAAIMESLETEILAKLGIADPYQDIG